MPAVLYHVLLVLKQVACVLCHGHNERDLDVVVNKTIRVAIPEDISHWRDVSVKNSLIACSSVNSVAFVLADIMLGKAIMMKIIALYLFVDI